MSSPLSVGDVLRTLASRAPFEKAAEWDPVGLQIGDPSDPVEGISLCHEVTESVVEALEQSPVDLLVTYHPLLFRPVRSLVAGASGGGRALRLARARVAVACVHTNFDVARGGAADALAETLGLAEARGFGPVHGPAATRVVTFVPERDADRVLDAVVAAGAGTVGRYTHCSFRAPGVGTFFAGEGTDPAVGSRGALNREPEVRLEFVAPRDRLELAISALVGAHPYEEPAYDVFERRGDAGMAGRIGRLDRPIALGDLAARVSAVLGAPAVRFAGDARGRVERVAVVPGAGSDYLVLAREEGAEVAVTGDVSHHRVRDALDRGLAVVDPGHAPTERPGLLRLEKLLGQTGVPLRSLLHLDPDPWVAASRS
jgi:dinuclear metal center YbgI/SA1388 family protein